MRTLILTLILLFFLPSAAKTKKIEANPINVAVMLTEQLDSAGIASTLLYYGYDSSSENSGSHRGASAGLSSGETKIYRHPNGSVIRFSFATAEDGKSYPTIEVKSKTSQKEKDQKLQELNFKKTGNHYERRSMSHLTRCASAPQGFLRFSNHPKPRQ